MPLSIDKKKKLFFYLVIFILLTTQIEKKQYTEKKFYSKKNNIEVSGLALDENLKISESLNPLFFKNIFFLDKNSFSKVLDKNSLIENFSIKKIYPNTINVNIKKTDFLAITKIKNKKYYIGSNGKLTEINKDDNYKKELPFVFTKNNYEDFLKLKKIIDKSKIRFEDIESFYYFQNNRWDFKTKNGVLIKLPEKKILDSLQTVYLIKLDRKFKETKTIDLRVSNNIIITNE